MRQKNIHSIVMGTVICSNLIYAGTLSHKKITHMVSKIKQERVGISLIKLNDTANPFILYVPPKEEVKQEVAKVKLVKKEIVYGLKAIMNHRGFINGKWYKEGDKLGEYKIGNITTSSVLLRGSKGNKTLKLKKKNIFKTNKGK